MPPKTKRQLQTIEAARLGREALKKARINVESEDPHSSPETLVIPSQVSLPQSSEETSGKENVDPDGRSPHEIQKEFVDEWVKTLDHEDRKSLAVFLCHNFVTHFSFTETHAAEYAAKMVYKSDRTVRQWRTDLVHNGGEFPDTKQGRYQRTGVLWSNEELNTKATQYIRENAAAKGQPNMT